MKTHKFFSWLLYSMGAGLVIGAFFIFRDRFGEHILELNIAVSLIMYSLFFIDVIFPWVNVNNSSHKEIGSIGIRWATTFTYALLAVGAMLVGNLVDPPLSFKMQLMIHCILFFGMLLGIFASYNAGLKVQEIDWDEKQLRSLLDDMKKRTANAHAASKNNSNLPLHLKNKVEQLNENMRYLSPSNNPEATQLEHEYLNMLAIFVSKLNKKDFELDPDALESTLQQCEQIYNNRKQTYSK